VAEALPEHARGKPVEVWFQDEARVGQQGTLTRVWARRGTRPRAPRDRRYAWAYLFGAVCPERAIGAGLVLPHVNTEAMGLHLAEIGRHVAPGAHALVVLDGAGWHGAGDLTVPDNLTLLPLPPRSPELNPVEGIWHYLKRVRLGNVCCRTLKEVRYEVRLATAILRHKATVLANLPQHYGCPL